jgi:endogenous inhibitor of DNA gyrase (YacG/DUF329 family)
MIKDPPMNSACPICRRPSDKAYAPFCSRRCADVDLQRWFSGRYVVPGAPPEDEETDAPDLGRDEEG